MIASLNKSQNTNIVLPDSYFTSWGIYSDSWAELSDAISTYITDSSLCNGAYSYSGSGAGYYISTPSDDGGTESMLRVWTYALMGTYVGSGVAKADVRPIVSIPTSKININGNTVTVLPRTEEDKNNEIEKLYNALKDVPPQEIVNGVEVDGIQTKFINVGRSRLYSYYHRI